MIKLDDEPVKVIHATPVKKGGIRAIVGFIIALSSIIGFWLPIYGLITAAVGLVVSLSGAKSSKRGFAVAGIIISIFFLILVSHGVTPGSGFDI